MPLYEYECKQCHQRMEKIQSFSAPLEKVCPKCGGELERTISAPAFQFKGAGWYVNDYAKSGKKDATASGADAKAEGKVDSVSAAGSDSKTETKSEGKNSNSSETKSSGDSAPASAPAPVAASNSNSSNSKPSQ